MIKRNQIIITSLAGVLLLIIASTYGLTRSFDWVITRPFSWVSHSIYSGTINSREATGRFFCPASQGTEEATKQIELLSEENARLKLAESENATLRAELGFLKLQDKKYIAAHVIGRPSNPYISAIIIDKGQRDGLSEGLPVITENGIIVGKITAIQSATSEVTLLNDSHSKLLTMAPGRKEGSGIIEGKFGLGLTMDLIPIAGELQNHDTIVTSGLETDIPSGLLVGTVTGLEFQPSDLFKTAQVKPAISYQNVRIVSVLLP